MKFTFADDVDGPKMLRQLLRLVSRSSSSPGFLKTFAIVLFFDD